MDNKLATLLSEVPARPAYNPVRAALDASKDRPDTAAALKLFVSMPPSTSVLANPVRHHHQLPARTATLELDVRSFTLRGKLFEEDIVSGKADAIRVICVGLFDRLPTDAETAMFGQFLVDSLSRGIDASALKTQEFMKLFPEAPPDVAIQHWAAYRKASGNVGAINTRRPPGELLAEMIEVHMENIAVAMWASAMRGGSSFSVPKPSAGDPFPALFSTLIRRSVNADEARILGQLGAIQVHHGSAGSNMVARYFATLHTRSVSDLFTASQMALDCGRHFGAISDMTDFVHVLEEAPESKRDDVIRDRRCTWRRYSTRLTTAPSP